MGVGGGGGGVHEETTCLFARWGVLSVYNSYEQFPIPIPTPIPPIPGA